MSAKEPHALFTYEYYIIYDMYIILIRTMWFICPYFAYYVTNTGATYDRSNSQLSVTKTLVKSKSEIKQPCSLPRVPTMCLLAQSIIYFTCFSGNVIQIVHCGKYWFLRTEQKYLQSFDHGIAVLVANVVMRLSSSPVKRRLATNSHVFWRYASSRPDPYQF